MNEHDFADTAHNSTTTNATTMTATMTATDWAGSCRLALLVSTIAAVAALVLSRVIDETALIVSVIVVSSAVSWFQLEHRPGPTPARMRPRHR